MPITSASSSTSPISRKPPEMMMAPLAPFSPALRMAPGTAAAGTTMTARSSVPGISDRSAQHFTPRISSALGLMG